MTTETPRSSTHLPNRNYFHICGHCHKAYESENPTMVHRAGCAMATDEDTPTGHAIRWERHLEITGVLRCTKHAQRVAQIERDHRGFMPDHDVDELLREVALDHQTCEAR